MKATSKRVLFATGLVLFTLMATEAIFAAAALVSPTIGRLFESPWVPPTVPDDRLRHRPNPAFPDHDARGFRNPVALERAEIVALGDSQTYGTGVRAADAWPRRLEQLTGRSVYGMAFGGYGPAHALVLWDEAVALHPDVVLVTFYSGNDLFDAFDLVHGNGQLPELASTDAGRLARIRTLEAEDPLGPRVMSLLFAGQQAPAQAPADQGDRSSLALADDALRAIRAHSKLYGLVRRLKFELSRRLDSRPASADAEWQAARALALANPRSYEIFEDDRFRTVFMSEYRTAALDLGDERIAEGLDIALRAIDRMNQLANERGIRLLVVVVPTKEAVFHEQWKTPSKGFERLAAAEAAVMTRVRHHLTQQHIGFSDVLGPLRARLESGEQPYPASQDGHPNAVGHQVIAEAVADALAH